MCLVLLVPIGNSYVFALTVPGNTGFFVRSVEWLRDSHASFLVAAAENVWYDFNQPPEGGPPLDTLSSPAETAKAPSSNGSASEQGLPKPKDVLPVVSPALSKEGVWAPAGQTLSGKAPILETKLRPDPLHPSVEAGLAWIDTSQIHLALVPGLSEPKSNLASGSGKVPRKDVGHLLATFNGGFKTKDGQGGFVADGKTYVSPKEGLGTIAIHSNGQVDIGEWGTEVKPSTDIAYLRQNLPLIVDGGAPNSWVNDHSPWVKNTVNNQRMVWRSGIGIDANGGLVYAASNQITERGLADLLVRAGAVRAMALDENSAFVDFFTYASPDGKSPSKLLPSMSHEMNRYLVPDSRDFFMVTS